nr:hypothetical protein B0A51_16403 [Rachicladosporium sp. CCFEE 5018]
MEEVLEVHGTGADEIARLMAPMVKLVQSVQDLKVNPEYAEATSPSHLRFADACTTAHGHVGAKAHELMKTSSAQPTAAESVPADTLQAEPAFRPRLIERKHTFEVSPDPAVAAEPTARRDSIPE